MDATCLVALAEGTEGECRGCALGVGCEGATYAQRIDEHEALEPTLAEFGARVLEILRQHANGANIPKDVYDWRAYVHGRITGAADAKGLLDPKEVR
jgi:hypothetical protein